MRLDWRDTKIMTLETRIAELERERDRMRELLREIACSGVTFSDERVGYVEVQIGREVWEELRREMEGE